jgi:hypothetical protein
MPINKRRSIILAMLSMAASKLAASQKDKGVSGPYCWAGKKDGEDVYIPCGSGLRSSAAIAEKNWLILDLSDFAGLRVVIDGEAYYVSRDDISTALAYYAKL